MTEGEEVKGMGNWMSGRRVEEATRGGEEERTRRRTVRRMRVKGQGKAKEEGFSTGLWHQSKTMHPPAKR